MTEGSGEDLGDWRGIAAKPTMYLGWEFRSRLEAKWAAFFDLLEWDWRYEPENLPGWLPDFLLSGPSGLQIYVEVKPEFYKVEGSYKAERALRKLRANRSVANVACLIVGEGVKRESREHDDWPVKIGTLIGAFDNFDLAYANAVLVTWRRGLALSYDLIPWGVNDGCLLGHGSLSSHSVLELSRSSAESLWAMAANRVRYQPVGPSGV